MWGSVTRTPTVDPKAADLHRKNTNSIGKTPKIGLLALLVMAIH
jgi:hypothetical protein